MAKSLQLTIPAFKRTITSEERALAEAALNDWLTHCKSMGCPYVDTGERWRFIVEWIELYRRGEIEPDVNYMDAPTPGSCLGFRNVGLAD